MLSCLITSPAVTVILPDKERVFLVIAVNICFDVLTGDATALVDVCNPSSSKYTTPWVL